MKTLVLLLGLCLAGCTDEAGSRKALEASGFTNIQFTGWELWGCSNSDDFATGFVATNMNGKRVKGIVYCGIWKSCTVRF
jgi:hypothetical protein